MNHRQSSGKLLVTACIGLLCIVGALLLVQYQGAIRDWVRVQQFVPSQSVAALASDGGMSDYGRYVFYTGKPSLENSADFTSSCGEHERSTAILGCYTNQQIYLFDVQNKELAGVEEVTAAHEMLHAAYERLSDTKRSEVDHLIESLLPTLEKDTSFRERMTVYKQLSKSEQLNELHSILGTEIAGLSSELETYYKQYFVDRSRVVALYRQYSGVFKKLEARAETLAQEYNQLVAARNQLVETSNQEYSRLTADIAAYERGPRTDAAAARALNRRADDFNARLTATRQQVAVYDKQIAALKAELEAIQIHTKQLNDSIDSTITAPAEEVHGG